MKVQFVSKEKLFPRFGAAWPKPQIAWVRNDLPESVKKFTEVHEVYHLSDPAKWWVWREIKANFAGAWKHPIGAIYCMLLTIFSFDRLKFYWHRIKVGK